MKKILLVIILIGSLVGSLSAQTKLKTDLTIEKASPMLYLNGTSAGINFYNGDITLQQSSNTLTLGGGDLALGTNNITMTGALGATGGRILKGWFTDLEVTNTITGTAASVTGFTRNSGTLSLSGGHGITLTTTGTTALTLPTSGTLAINPMTTAGAIVIGGVGGAPTSLVAGTDGYTLTMTAGAPAWGPPAGGGGAMIYPLAGIAISTGSSWGTSLVDNHIQWDTAYVARNRWDGGAISLVPATGRTSLGGTTVGQNIFTLTNPDAIRFLRINADNTVTALSAANFKTALSLVSSDVGLGNVTNESKATMFTAPTFTGHPTIEGVTATGATGTGNLVFSASPTFSGTVTGTFSGGLTGTVTGSITGNAATVTGFTRNSGTLTLSGGHGITLTTTGITSLTLPTSGTLVANPMSAAGDLIIGGTSGAPSRLAATTNGYVLTLSAGAPVWAATLETTLETRIDSIVTVLSDTTNIETLLGIDLDTDTVADLSELRLKLNISDTSSMLTPYVARADTSAMLGSYVRNGELVDSLDLIRTALNDTVVFETEELSDALTLLATIKTDTIPLFVFGLGSGDAADTTVFKANAIAGAFYNAGSDTLMITSIRGVLAEGSGTESVSVQISWHATFKSGSATTLNSSPLAITSITTGTEDTSFAASTIPPNVWVWCTISGLNLGDRPSLLILTMSGYKQNRSY